MPSITKTKKSVLSCLGRAALQRWRNLASGQERMLYLVSGRHYYYLHWLPREGYALRAAGNVACWPQTTFTKPLRLKRLTMKKREAIGLGGVAMPGPAPTSTILGKLKTIREFMSTTAYDDGSPRAVSALRITSRGTVWQLTLTDPDTYARLPVQDASLDDALALMEKLLQSEQCPWEPDPYNRPPAPKASKKK